MKKIGQIWIETVLYTLIAIVLIGTVLAFVTPKIKQAQDRAAIEQSIAVLDLFDEKIEAVLQLQGNSRNIDITVKRGELYIIRNSILGNDFLLNNRIRLVFSPSKGLAYLEREE